MLLKLNAIMTVFLKVKVKLGKVFNSYIEKVSAMKIKQTKKCQFHKKKRMLVDCTVIVTVDCN